MSDIQLSCHTEAWGERAFIRAISEISTTGFEGVETSPGLVLEYEDRVSVIKEILDDINVELSAISAEVGELTEENLEMEVERALNTARFVNASGSNLLLLSVPQYGVDGPTPEQAKLAAEWLNQVGKVTLDLDVITVWQPIIGEWPRTSSEITKFTASLTAKYVKLCYDAWMLDAGVPITTFLSKHGSRVKYIVLRDMKVTTSKKKKSPQPARVPVMQRLGKGNLPLKRLCRALFTKGFEGWVSLRLPTASNDPCNDARKCLEYIENELDLLV